PSAARPAALSASSWPRRHLTTFCRCWAVTPRTAARDRGGEEQERDHARHEEERVAARGVVPRQRCDLGPGRGRDRGERGGGGARRPARAVDEELHPTTRPAGAAPPASAERGSEQGAVYSERAH